METEALMELTAEIVASQVGHNRVDANDVPRLIQSVFSALAGIGQPAPVAEERPKPAVTIRASVKPDAITCLECGVKLKMLKRHLIKDHNTTPADYRVRWRLPSGYPMVAPNYADMRRDLAEKIGLGRKPGTKIGSNAAPKPAGERSESLVDENVEA